MASAAVMTAVEARLAANWTHTPIVSPNQADQVPPADGTAFLAVQYPVSEETQASIGSPGANVWREEGAFRFVLHLPRGTGLGEWPSRLDALRAAFRGKVFDGVRTYGTNPPGEDGIRGAYELHSFSVAYEFDLIG